MVTASIIVAPIGDSRLEDWKAFLGELTVERRGQWAESQRRRGITREVIYLHAADGGSAAVYLVEGVEATAAIEALWSSGHPFDRWYRGRLEDLHGEFEYPSRLFDTRPPPGGWRGWRGLAGWRRRLR
jgi:hypothetical protein